MWHHEVLKMVLHTIESGRSEELVASLFEQGELIRRVTSSAQTADR
jgi:hypothetical protein